MNETKERHEIKKKAYELYEVLILDWRGHQKASALPSLGWGTELLVF